MLLSFSSSIVPNPSNLQTPIPYSTYLISNNPQIQDLPAPHTGRIRILTLSRPSARNAISVALLSELREAISSIASEYTPEGDEAPPKKIYGGAAGVDGRGPTRAVILASDVDSSFCAGADLKERKGFTPEQCVPLFVSPTEIIPREISYES